MATRTRLSSPLALLLCLCTVSVVRGFYIPGVAPTEYEEGDTLEIKVRCSSVGWWVGCEWAGTVFVGEEDMNHVVVGRGGGRNTLSVEREREKWFDC